MANQKIRVLIVDDSPSMRMLLAKILVSDQDIEVVGTATDAFQARQKILELKPDVLTLDVEMPGMDGITFLQKLMRAHPMPVVMVSRLTQAGASTTLRALDLGAVDIFSKPTADPANGVVAGASEIIAKIHTAAKARIVGYPEPGAKRPDPASRPSRKIVAVGASTGGVEAVRSLLSELPANGPAVVIAQHLPESFTKAYADQLDSVCAMNVRQAEDGDRMAAGTALVAPGDRHICLVKQGRDIIVRAAAITEQARYTPCIDVLFYSCATAVGSNAVGIVLTGASSDGARGLKRMRDAGARTIAQDEATSKVFEMPSEAINCGGAEFVLPIGKIAEEALRLAA